MQASNSWESWGNSATPDDKSPDEAVGGRQGQIIESEFDDITGHEEVEAGRGINDTVDPLSILNEDAKPQIKVKQGFLSRIVGSFSDKTETVVTVLFVVKDVYRWYNYNLMTHALSAVDEPQITFSLIVWHDKLTYIKSSGAKRNVKKELLRESGITVSDFKRLNDSWYYFDDEFVREMQQLGFSKMYSLQLAADAIMFEHGLTPNQMLYFSNDNVFAARVVLYEDKVVEQSLFNSEDYAIQSIFAHLLTTNKIEVNERHVYECTFSDLVSASFLQPSWLLEERIFSLPIMPVNLALLALIGVGVVSVMTMQGAHLVMESNHQNRKHESQQALAQLQAQFDDLLNNKRPFIPQHLSINFDRFIENAREVYRVGLKIEGTTEFNGQEKYTTWWRNGQTPLVSFLNTSVPKNCEVITKVSGNGEMAYKEINCLYPTIFVGRFNPS